MVLCAGTNPSGTDDMLEQPCPGPDGTGGGGHGVLWVLKSVKDVSTQSGTWTLIINVRTTNDTHDAYGHGVCIFGQRSAVLHAGWADNGNPDQGGCHWREYP